MHRRIQLPPAEKAMLSQGTAVEPTLAAPTLNSQRPARRLTIARPRIRSPVLTPPAQSASMAAPVVSSSALPENRYSAVTLSAHQRAKTSEYVPPSRSAATPVLSPSSDSLEMRPNHALAVKR